MGVLPGLLAAYAWTSGHGNGLDGVDIAAYDAMLLCCYAAMQLKAHVLIKGDHGRWRPGWQSRSATKRPNGKSEKLVKKTGEGPSALIARLVGDERNRLTDVQKFELARRQHAIRELLAMLPALTEESKLEMDRIQHEMYDENGVPR